MGQRGAITSVVHCAVSAATTATEHCAAGLYGNLRDSSPKKRHVSSELKLRETESRPHHRFPQISFLVQGAQSLSISAHRSMPHAIACRAFPQLAVAARPQFFETRPRRWSPKQAMSYASEQSWIMVTKSVLSQPATNRSTKQALSTRCSCSSSAAHRSRSACSAAGRHARHFRTFLATRATTNRSSAPRRLCARQYQRGVEKARNT